MKINVAKSAGFCFGVKRAIDIALKTAICSKAAVYMLGDIVHNEDVVRKLARAGVKKLNTLSSGTGNILLIRAHGASPQILREAKKKGYRVFDATCPMVKEIHRIARKMENKGYNVIIIGDKKHEEVAGIAGQLKKSAIIIEGVVNKIPFSRIKRIRKACVVVQSTQNIEETLKVVGVLRKKIPELRFFNTICRPTQLKQEEIRRMPLKNNVMVIIGSKKSANTKRLFQISKSLNPRTFWVNTAKELKKGWFKEAHSVGITAGASTPDETTRKIICALQRLK